MTILTQIIIIAAGFLFLLQIVRAMILRKITEKQGIFCLIPAVLIILGGAFPSITYILADIFHAEYAPSIIFALAIISLYLIAFECFKTLAVLTSKNQELAMQVSMLNQENMQLQKRLQALEKQIPEKEGEAE